MQGKNALPTIESLRLLLIAADPETLRAEMRSHEELSHVLGVHVPETWPPLYMDDAARHFWLDQLEAHPEDSEWWGRYIVLKDTRILVGGGGCAGPPDVRGEVIIGYSILAEFQQRGYATEAVKSLLAHAFDEQRTTACVAETFANLRPSIRVLEKCGFVFTGPGGEPGTIRYRLARGAWQRL